MVDKLLKFGGRFGIPARPNERLSAYVCRVQTAKSEVIVVEAVHRQLVRASNFQPLHAVCGLPPTQRGQPPKNRFVREFHKRVFREAFGQIFGERLGLRSASRKRQREGYGIFNISPLGKLECRYGARLSFSSIPAQGFPDGSRGSVSRRRTAGPPPQRYLDSQVR